MIKKFKKRKSMSGFKIIFGRQMQLKQDNLPRIGVFKYLSCIMDVFNESLNRHVFIEIVSEFKLKPINYRLIKEDSF